MQLETTRWLLGVGALWMVLTFTLAAVLGRALVDGIFERVMADYDPRLGGLTLLGMPVPALSPLVAARMLGIRDESLKYAGER